MQDVKPGDIMFSRLTPRAEELYREQQCGFRSNRTSIDLIFCIRQILEKKWEYRETVCQLFIGFKVVHDSFRRETLCNVVSEFGIPTKLMKMLRLTKICLNETYNRAQVGKICLTCFPLRMV
jgi:hypothetical protein